jgi:hypothetical protein
MYTSRHIFVSCRNQDHNSSFLCYVKAVCYTKLRKTRTNPKQQHVQENKTINPTISASTRLCSTPREPALSGGWNSAGPSSQGGGHQEQPTPFNQKTKLVHLQRRQNAITNGVSNAEKQCRGSHDPSKGATWGGRYEQLACGHWQYSSLAREHVRWSSLCGKLRGLRA